MAGPRDKDVYGVVVVQRGQSPDRWEWEIHRNGQPLPVRLRNGNFTMERAAKAAAKVALRQFIEALNREQNTLRRPER
jgi:hypothetical protein